MGKNNKHNYLESERIGDIAMQVFTEVEEKITKPCEISGIPTGFLDFDKLTSGINPGDLIVIGGRPGMGKTALAHNIAINFSLLEKVPTLYFTLETTKNKLALRILSSMARIDTLRLRNFSLKDEDWPKLVRAIGLLEKTKLYIEDEAINISEISEQIEQMTIAKGIGAVFIDYLQLVSGPIEREHERRDLELGVISRTLKRLAKNLNIPIILISSLNRQIESRVDKRPLLHDIRDSGAVEDDADLVIFIYRDDIYNMAHDNPLKGQAELIVAKHRLGRVGTVKMVFIDCLLTFENMVYFED